MNFFTFFFIGILTGLFLAVILIRQRGESTQAEDELEMVMSQSVVYRVSEMISEMMDNLGPTQSQLYGSEPVSIRFVQSPDDKIYWIEDDVLYCTDIGEEGFDLNEKLAVKTESLTEDELEQLLIILNILQNG
jgi:hypothetical protein